LIAAALVGLALVAVALTARLFLWPPSARPVRVDAVVVLSGDFGGRLPEAQREIATHLSGVLVHAGTPDLPTTKVLCTTPPAGFEMICLHPVNDSTRTEAQAVASLARTRHWRTIAVVTSSYHVTRAGMLFRRCVDGDVRMIAAKEHFGWRFRLRRVAHEWGGLVKALTVARGC
jgi:uncharacterized SAM-binding protein YcdF (DUF218 family)